MTAQFFAVQAIAKAAWRQPYSDAKNYISDLGAAHCAFYPPHSHTFVCSPLYMLMDGSLTTQGLLMTAGALLWQQGFAQDRATKIALPLIALAGIGSVFVGLFPEDVNVRMHVIGAAIHFICGNVGIIVLGAAMLRKRKHYGPIGLIPLISGIVGSTATISLIAGNYWSLGIGGIERVAIYPFPISLILIGLYTLRRKLRMNLDIA